MEKVTKEILKLVKDMEETTVAANGAGLAAPQIGRKERICVAMIADKLTPLINPVISWKSEQAEIMEEGCLSLPDAWIFVPRPVEIRVEFIALDGKPLSLHLAGWDARVVQHEVDHLEGVLIVDYR